MKSRTDVGPSPPAGRSSAHAKSRARTLAALRAEAEAAKAQLQAMQALTDTALSHLALDDLLRELLGRVTAVMDVDNVGIFLLEQDGQTLTLRAVRGLEEEAVGRVQVAVGQGVPGRIAVGRVPLIVNDLSATELEGLSPRARERLHARAGVPLLVQDQVEGERVDRLVGVLTVGSATPGHFTEAGVQLLQRAADRIALAVDRAVVYAAEQDARRRAEDALARALVSETQATDRAQRLQTILETITDGVAVYDMAGRPIQSNRAYRELFSVERGPADFESLSVLDRADLTQLRETTGAAFRFEASPIGRALRGEEVRGPGMDLSARAFDGRVLELNASAAPMRDGDGHVIGAVVVVHDVTEHNRLEREHEAARAGELAARAASQRMEEFLATAAHDLRTPLTATVGYLTLARDKTEQLAAAVREACPDLTSKAEAARKRMDDADQSAARLTRLLTRLFDTAAVRADRLELHRAPCDLVALVREQVEALCVAAPDRAIHLQTPPPSADGGQVLVEADADRIRQVVANYVSNAIKYSPPDQPVDVFVEARRGRARVAVRDGGAGIPKAERAQVWDLFHRVPGITPQGTMQGGALGGAQSGSLGLGLHISKAIIEAHGGRVGVKSAVGQGSTFWFTLTLSDSPAGAAPGSTDAAS